VAEGWHVELRRGSAQFLHDLDPAEPATPTIWVCEPTGAAVVLGSTQRDLHLDEGVLGASGLDVAHRRSGGGVVVVDPHATVWIDLLIPAGHRLWVDDVGAAMHWVGDTWARALTSLGLEVRVHRGPLDQRRWGRLVCVAGLGPGEVVDAQGRKLVGVSQRRSREVARFQTIASLASPHGGPTPDLAGLLGLGADDTAALQVELEATTASLPFARSVVIEAVLDSLPG
jgi:lipoate---protein ligase